MSCVGGKGCGEHVIGIIVINIIIGKLSSSLMVVAALLAACFFGWCISGSVMGLLLCVGTVAVGKSVAGCGVVIGNMFLSSCALLLSALLSAVDCVSVYEVKGVEVVFW